MAGVGCVECRVSGYGTVLGTVPALFNDTVLALYLPLPCLAWSKDSSVYALVDTRVLRASWVHPGTP